MERKGNAVSDIGITEHDVAVDMERDNEVGVEAEAREEEVGQRVDEEEGGEEGGEEEGDNEDDEAYTFRFKEGENPFDFVEETAFSIQPYKKFERLEYEALAEKKRKTVADNQGRAKKAREDDITGATMEEIMEAMNYGARRKSRKSKKRGRRKGSKNRVSLEVEQMVGHANSLYSRGRNEESIAVLRRAVLLAPDFPDSYHILGLVYRAMGDESKALGFYMLAAHLRPKEPSLWKLLFSWSKERGDIDQVNYCLSKAIAADPKDTELLLYRAKLYVRLKDYQKAAESYYQLHQRCVENVMALKMGAKLYQKCGQLEHSIDILENYIKGHPNDADSSVTDFLASIYMESKEYSKALQHIEHALEIYSSQKELSLNLTIKAGICHMHLGNMEQAEVLIGILKQENASEYPNFIDEVADSFMSVEEYHLALKYYLMLDGKGEGNNGLLHLKIAECYLSVKDRVKAILFFYKALQSLEDNIDVRLTLASLLLEEAKGDEAILLLSPPKDMDLIEPHLGKSKLWWHNEKVKLKLAHIFRAKGMVGNIADSIFPVVRESLYIETSNLKFKAKKKLPTRVLLERVKVLDGRGTGNLFRGLRPLAPKAERSRASRALKLLQKREKLNEERKAAGVDWHDDNSDNDTRPRVYREPPLPDLLKGEENLLLIADLCKALASLKRYPEALELISLTLRSAFKVLSLEKKEELQLLGAQLAFATTDTKHGFNYVKYIVKQHLYSLAAWNCYYKVTLRMKNRDSRHCKLINSMQANFKECVPPVVIAGHQFTTISHHQDAARKYLEAYKLSPNNPLINLCVGTALINLALGFRLQNKHQCLAQGLAFLYNNLRLCDNSQEALYNMARAYHHVGMVTLAVSYYQKALAIYEKDQPIPKLAGENEDSQPGKNLGYCDLRREAAYNLHLIYRNSGATDLARQVLRDHCTF